jgi:hypothetical protein
MIYMNNEKKILLNHLKKYQRFEYYCKESFVQEFLKTYFLNILEKSLYQALSSL